MLKLTLLLLLAVSAYAQTCPGTEPITTTVLQEGDASITDSKLEFWIYTPKNQVLSIFMGGETDCNVVDNTPNAIWARTTTLTNCDAWKFSYDTPTALNDCGFVQTVGSTVTSFITKPKFTSVYDVENVFGNTEQRTDQTDIQFAINFDNSVAISAAVFVIPAAVTYSAVIESEFNTNNAVQTYTFVTQGPNPYVLTEAASSTSNAKFEVSTPTSINSGCDASITDFCTQTWTFTVTPDDYCTSVFEADQVLTLDFTIDCDGSFTGACTTPENPAAQFTINVDTDNYCPQVVEVVAVTASIETKSGSFAGPDSAAYTFGGTIFGIVDIQIPSGILIDTTTINTVSVSNGCTGTCDETISLYNNAATTEGTDAAIDVVDSLADKNRHSFQFDVNEDSVDFDDGANTGSAVITITVGLTIVYNTAADQRVTQELNLPVNFATGTAIGLAPSASAGVSTPGSATSTSTVLGVTQGTAIIAGVALVAVLALAVVAAVTIRRKQVSNLDSAAAKASSSTVQLNAVDATSSNAEAGIVGTNDLRVVQNAYGHA